MRKVLCVCVLLMILAGCQNDVAFDKPQPPDTKPSNAFPDRLRGMYSHADGPQSLDIAEKTVTSIYDYDVKMAKNKLDTGQYLSGDTLVNTITGERHPVTFSGDSVILHNHEVETLFSISDTNVLKKYKGYYFLNRYIENSRWQVYRLALEKNMLIVGRINDSADIALLKEISENTKDSTGYVFRPTQKQFTTYLKRDGFKDRDTFMRAK